MCTVHFFVTQNLREINIGDSRRAKSAIERHLYAVDFDFYECLHILKVEIHQINTLKSPNDKNGSFRMSSFSKIDFL